MKDKDGERKKEAESAGLEQVEQSFLQMFEGATLTWNLAIYVLITHTDTHTCSFSHLFSSPCAFFLTHKQSDKTQWIFLPGSRKQYPDKFFPVLLSIYEFLRGAERFGVCMCVFQHWRCFCLSLRFIIRKRKRAYSDPGAEHTHTHTAGEADRLISETK